MSHPIQLPMKMSSWSPKFNQVFTLSSDVSLQADLNPSTASRDRVHCAHIKAIFLVKIRQSLVHSDPKNEVKVRLSKT